MRQLGPCARSQAATLVCVGMPHVICVLGHRSQKSYAQTRVHEHILRARLRVSPYHLVKLCCIPGDSGLAGPPGRRRHCTAALRIGPWRVTLLQRAQHEWAAARRGTDTPAIRRAAGGDCVLAEGVGVPHRCARAFSSFFSFRRSTQPIDFFNEKGSLQNERAPSGAWRRAHACDGPPALRIPAVGAQLFSKRACRLAGGQGG
jgi:hypothetical protein